MSEAMEPAGGGPLPEPDRWRNTVKLMLCVALGGVVLGGWSLYGSYQSWQDREESRTAIREACAGLLDPDEVLRLDGGHDRLVRSEVKSRRHLDLKQLPDECVLLASYEENGKSRAGTHFGLKVHEFPQQGLHGLGSGAKPFTRSGEREAGEDITDRADEPLVAPLGDGSAGSYSGRTVSVNAVCERPVAGVTGYRAYATARYGDPTAKDRRALARIARTAAVRAAERKGCATTPPELPAELPAQGRTLGPADRAEGSCAWYAAFLRDRQDRSRLPDKALGVRSAERSGAESCLLALDTDTREGLRDQIAAERPDSRSLGDFRNNPWWLKTFAYFGDDAAGTGLEPGGSRQTGITDGQAGRALAVRYATATCQGRRAVLGMEAHYEYERFLGARLDEAFTAYATATAARRGCTGLVLPGPE
ncbi:hypothetical protein [Streptomyces sp. NBC_00091]|uniref:hypothetical protein n=1 Tax=Streptomyces sp. NBC_00091 TaxID=2975648 RepID=UPI0022500B3D|nr:hypothetical protein [Streptomyces sp. NBC_00091]MCX5377025.1 hypothetical protein [Streptomyces sp. NBC_00091]